MTDIFTSAGMLPAIVEPEKAWIPAELMDEISPPGRATPDAWAVPFLDGIGDEAGRGLNTRALPRPPPAALHFPVDTPVDCPQYADMARG